MKRTVMLLAAGLALAQPAHATSLRFTNITSSAGITHLYYQPSTGVNVGALSVNSDVQAAWFSGGAVAEDFNGDGWTDLYALQGESSNILYLNAGNGTFSNATAGSGLGLASNSMGAAAADIDNDGDIDITVTCFSNVPHLFLNNGAGVFTDKPITIDVGAVYARKRYMSPSLGDLDNDGYLDMALGLWNVGYSFIVFPNTGGTNLYYSETIHEHSATNNQWVFSPAFADVDGDRLADLPLTTDFHRSQLYRNTGANFLERITPTAGAIATDENGMGCAIADYDNDGDLDWFVSSIRDTNGPPYGNWGLTGNRLYRNNGAGFFTDATDEAGVRDGNWGWGACFEDFDNDGDLDLFHVNGTAATLAYDTNLLQFVTNVLDRFYNQPARLFENGGTGAFVEVASAAGAADTGEGRAVVPFDYDQDGDIDLFIVNNQVISYAGTNLIRNPAAPSLLRNDTPATNQWINVTLDGTPPFHRHGIGARVHLRAGGSRQMRELHASTGYLGHGPKRIAHFGLGTNTFVDEIRAEWHSGAATLVENVSGTNRVVLPSPAAVLSTNSIQPGQFFTASATNIAPTGTSRYWTFNGASNSDPFTATSYVGGTNELRLRMFDGTGTNLLRTELHRVHVRTAEMRAFDKYFLPNEWILIWEVESGRIYRVQSSTNGVAGSWTNRTAAITSKMAAAYFTNVPGSGASTYFRVLELAP